MTAPLTLREARATWPSNPDVWTLPGALQRLERMYADRASYVEMASCFGTSPDDVYTQVRRLGLIGRYPERAARKVASRELPPAPDAHGFPKRKTCLKCRQPFMAKGRHNHLCPACGAANARDRDWDLA